MIEIYVGYETRKAYGKMHFKLLTKMSIDCLRVQIINVVCVITTHDRVGESEKNEKQNKMLIVVWLKFRQTVCACCFFFAFFFFTENTISPVHHDKTKRTEKLRRNQ